MCFLRLEIKPDINLFPYEYETTSYLRQFDAFANSSAQYCMTCLTWDPMGEIQGDPMILLPTVIITICPGF